VQSKHLVTVGYQTRCGIDGLRSYLGIRCSSDTVSASCSHCSYTSKAAFDNPNPTLTITPLQFEAEGAMVLLLGLVLNSRPFPASDLQVSSMLSPLQASVVWLGCTAVWPVLLSEVANSWWGTKSTLPILHAAGVPSGWTATQWQELVVTVAHYGGSPLVVAAVSITRSCAVGILTYQQVGIVLYALFKNPQQNSIQKRKL
jgi:hypothetical protein